MQSFPGLLLLALGVAIPGRAMAQLTVTGTVPARWTMHAPMQPIEVAFAQPVDLATVDAGSFAVFGRWSGPVAGAIALSADHLTARLVPARPLFVGELLTITLSAAIATPGGQHLTGGHVVQALVRGAPGTRTFTNAATIPLRAPGEGRIGTYGIFSGDVDRDGAPDLTALDELGNDIRVLHNSGCGLFGAPVAVANPGQWPSPNEGADFDRDGFLDLVTGNQNAGAVSVYLNTGSGLFGAPAVYTTSGFVHGVAPGDFDGDGYWDLAAPNGNAVAVFLNAGDGTMTTAGTYDAGGNGEDNVTAVDVDEDGHLDLLVGNLYSGTVGVLLGAGDGTFALHGAFATGGQPFHQAIGDCNGDGHVDVVFANRGTNTLALLLGDGHGNFAAPDTRPVGLGPAAVDLADLDGDRSEERRVGTEGR